MTDADLPYMSKLLSELRMTLSPYGRRLTMAVSSTDPPLAGRAVGFASSSTLPAAAAP